MSYCQQGDNPKINFKFKGQREQTYISKYSPIDVETEEYSVNGANYSESGYRIQAYSRNNFVTFSVVVRNHEIKFMGAGNFSHLLRVQQCNDAQMFDFQYIDINTLQIFNDATCPVSIPDIRKAKLKIKNAVNNVLIFEVEGLAPLTFNVACRDCPPGQCRCESRNYPGYCCISCNELAKEVNSITQMVKRVNNG